MKVFSLCLLGIVAAAATNYLSDRAYVAALEGLQRDEAKASETANQVALLHDRTTILVLDKSRLEWIEYARGLMNRAIKEHRYEDAKEISGYIKILFARMGTLEE